MALEPPAEAREIADWLRTLKDESGLSFAAIAQAVGEEQRNVTRWMPDKGRVVIPGGASLLRLLSALGVRLEPPAPDTAKAVNAKIEELRVIVDRIDQMLQVLRSEEVEGGAGSSGQLRVAAHLQALEDAVDRQGTLVEHSLGAVELRLGRIDERLGLPAQPETEIGP